MKKISWALVIALLLLGACASLAEPSATDVPELLEPVGVRMDSEPVRRGEISQIDIYNGAVITEIFEGYFQVDGELKSVNVCIGDRVKKGDVLMTLNEQDLIDRLDALSKRIEYEEKNGELELKRMEIDISMQEVRLKQLTDTRADEKEAALLKEDIRAMRTKIDQQRDLQLLSIDTLKAEKIAIEEKLGKDEIIAPHDGRVTFIKNVEEKERVLAYDKLVCVTDDNSLIISSEFISEMLFSGAHRYYAMIGSNEYEIELEPVDWQENIMISLSGGELRSKFRILNADDDVKAGMYVGICLVSRYSDNALIIPRNALITDATGKYVYKMENGSRVRQTVKTGITTNTQLEIVEGLNEGDEVFVKD